MLFLTMAVARTDQGIVPALATTLKEVFGFSNAQIGTLGSAVYIGAVFGKNFLMIYVFFRFRGGFAQL
jgi:hypothetical protein